MSRNKIHDQSQLNRQDKNEKIQDFKSKLLDQLKEILQPKGSVPIVDKDYINQFIEARFKDKQIFYQFNQNQKQKQNQNISEIQDQPNAIRYKLKNTIRFNQDINKHIETDKDFIQDVKLIAEKHRQNNNFKGIQFEDQDYDKFYSIAQFHHAANKVNSNNLKKQGKRQQDKCPCGCQKYKGQDLKYFTDVKNLQYLGQSVVSIFFYLKALSIIMLFTLSIYGIFAIITNIVGSQTSEAYKCSSYYCKFINNSSNRNKISPNKTMVIQWWIGLFISLIWIIYGATMYKYTLNKNEQIDQKLVTASDVCIMLQLSQSRNKQKDIIDLVQNIQNPIKTQNNNNSKNKNKIKNKNNLQQLNETISNNQLVYNDNNQNHFDLKSIQIIYSFQFVRKMTKQIIKLCQQLPTYLKVVKSNQNNQKKYVQSITDQSKYTQRKDKLIIYYQILKDLKKKFLNDKDPEFRSKIPSTICFIQLENEQSRKQLQQYRYIDSIYIQRAPEPSDVIWENVQYAQKNITFQGFKVILYVIVINFIFATVFHFFRMWFAPKDSSGEIIQGSIRIIILDIFQILVLLLINKYFSNLFDQALEQTKCLTMTYKLRLKIMGYQLALLFNIIIVPLIYNLEIVEKTFGPNGLQGFIFNYQISSLVAGLFFKLIKPMTLIIKIVMCFKLTRKYFIKIIMWWYSSSKDLNYIKKKQELLEKGIPKINSFYQCSQFEVAQSYIYILSVIFHAAFFCELQPGILIISTLITILYYFVIKANLLYFCKQPSIINRRLIQQLVLITSLFPFLYGIGSLVNSYNLSIIIDKQQTSLYYHGVITYILFWIFCILIICYNLYPSQLVKKIYNFFKLIDNKANEQSKEQLNILKSKKRYQTKQEKPKKPKKRLGKIDNYYKNSPALDLIAFQQKILGQKATRKDISKYRKFCQSFFQKRDQQQKKPNSQTIKVESNQHNNKINQLPDQGKNKT